MRSFTKCLVPPAQQAYVDSHPLGKWVSIGVLLSGLVNALVPSLTNESAVAMLLPQAVLVAFNLTWALGGGLCTFGLMRGKAKVEGAGMALLASGVFSYWLTAVYLRPKAAVAGLFIACLAYGCLKRAMHLYSHGYVVLDVPLDQPGMK